MFIQYTKTNQNNIPLLTTFAKEEKKCSFRYHMRVRQIKKTKIIRKRSNILGLSFCFLNEFIFKLVYF